MPALPSIVATYVTGLVDSLKQGGPLDQLVPPQTYAPGLNFLRASDLSAAMELLQNALTSGTMTPVAGGGNTVRSLQDGVSTFNVDQQVGNYVLFNAGPLAGERRRIISNSTTTLSFAGPDLPAVPTIADTYIIEGGIMADEIADIRGGKGLSDGTVPVYADSRVVAHALTKLITQLGGTVASPLMGSMTAASGTTTSVVIDTSARGAEMRIDEFRGMEATVAAKGTRIIASNTANTLILSGPLTSAAAASDAVTIHRPIASTAAAWSHKQFAGGHPDSALLADLMDQARARVVAYTLPT